MLLPQYWTSRVKMGESPLEEVEKVYAIETGWTMDEPVSLNGMFDESATSAHPNSITSCVD